MNRSTLHQAAIWPYFTLVLLGCFGHPTLAAVRSCLVFPPRGGMVYRYIPPEAPRWLSLN